MCEAAAASLSEFLNKLVTLIILERRKTSFLGSWGYDIGESPSQPSLRGEPVPT